MRFALLLSLSGSLALLAACGENSKGGRAAMVPTVVVSQVETHRFTTGLNAVGTAYAREQAALTAPVTERIESIAYADGAYVPKGAVLVRLAASEESASMQEAQARATAARLQLDRLKTLQARGFATNASVEAQSASYASARAQADEMRARISDRTIRAPFAGVVGLRRLSAGAVIAAGTPVATISDINEIKLDFSVPETQLAAIQKGQAIEASSAAYPNKRFAGRVHVIEPTIDPMTRAVSVRAILPNKDGILKPGMLLNVQVITATRTALAVPDTAIIAERDKEYIFLVMQDGTARRTEIQTGARDGHRVEVRKGVAQGSRIIVEGTIKVRDGAQVKAVTAADAAVAAPSS